MSGIQNASDISLPRDPVENMHAATKGYVDKQIDAAVSEIGIVGLGTAAKCDFETVLSGSATLLPTSEAVKNYVTTAISQIGPTGAVESVNGKTGAVVLAAADVGAIAASEKGAAAGVATLDDTSKIPLAQLPVETALSDSASVVPTSAAIKAYIDNAIAELKQYVDNALANSGSGGSTESEITGSETAVPTSAAVKKFVEASLPKLYQIGDSTSPSTLTQAKVGDFYYKKSFQGKTSVGYLSKLPVTGNGSWLLISTFG